MPEEEVAEARAPAGSREERVVGQLKEPREGAEEEEDTDSRQVVRTAVLATWLIEAKHGVAELIPSGFCGRTPRWKLQRRVFLADIYATPFGL